MNDSKKNNPVESIVSLFNEYKKNICEIFPSIDECREDAVVKLKEYGLPTLKNEEYKYLDVANIFNEEFIPYFLVSKQETEMPHLVSGIVAYIVILYNGILFKDDIPILPEGIEICEINAVAEKHSQYFKNNSDGMAALNTMFAAGGFFVNIKKKVKVDKPILIINNISADNMSMLNSRNIVVAGEQSEVKIVFYNNILSHGKVLINDNTDVILSEEAIAEIYSVQNEKENIIDFSHKNITQKRGSNLLINTVTLDGGIVRNNIRVKHDGPGCESKLFGLLVASEKKHIDTFVFVDHASPQCVSNQLFKAIVNDNATGVFNGKILVRKDSQKTNAFQLCRAIVLSDSAKMHTRPQLEIYADDVKCTHGATVGQLDQDALFYMRSRGISAAEAKRLLIQAFAAEITETISIDGLKEAINDIYLHTNI